MWMKFRESICLRRFSNLDIRGKKSEMVCICLRISAHAVDFRQSVRGRCWEYVTQLVKGVKLRKTYFTAARIMILLKFVKFSKFR